MEPQTAVMKYYTTYCNISKSLTFRWCNNLTITDCNLYRIPRKQEWWIAFQH